MLEKEAKCKLKVVLKKLNKPFSETVKFIIHYDTSKISHFCSTKDPVPALLKSNIIKLSCPGCLQQFIVKTDRSLALRLREYAYATRQEQPMNKHLSNYNYNFN